MRPIDADSLKVRLSGCMILMPNGEKCTAKRAIDTQGTIEPEVRHGRWAKSDVYTFKKCSECGAVWDAALCENIFFIYCPRCGSKNGGADNG